MSAPKSVGVTPAERRVKNLATSMLFACILLTLVGIGVMFL